MGCYLDTAMGGLRQVLVVESGGCVSSHHRNLLVDSSVGEAAIAPWGALGANDASELGLSSRRLGCGGRVYN